MNQIVISGNLTKDPETKTTASGAFVVKLSVAVRSNRKEADGTYGTEFFDCIAFGKTGDFAVRYLRKGMKVIVYGSMQSRKVQKDMTTITYWDVAVNGIENAMSKTDEQGNQQQPTFPKPAYEYPPKQEKPSFELDDDDLPF